MRGVAILLLLLPGCAMPPEPADRHPTIVSLNPCTDAMLAEVAAPGQVLAISHYSHDPQSSSMPQAQARRFRATGGTVEEVLALRPDVVVAGSFLPPATAAALARLGVRVETFGVATTVADSEAQVRRIAAIAHQRDAGEALVARIEQALDATRAAGPPVPALLWQEGGIVPGPLALVTRLMAHAGLASHSAARGLGQGAYLPLEEVLADPPALILTTGQERLLDHPALGHLPSARHARIDPALLYCGGPTIVRAVARFAALRRSL